MMTGELILIGGVAGTVLLMAFYLAYHAMVLVDRLTDKIMSDKNPSAFATYATTTPTAKEETFSHSGNGKMSARTPGQDDLPSYLEIP
jgi:hypothetical protein